MPTPITKLGTLRPLANGWEALIRIDGRGTRRGFALVALGACDEPLARERCNAMALMALRLRQAARVAEIPKLMEMAARARAGRGWDAVVAAVDALCAGTTEPLSEAARVTVAEFGKQWRSGELHQRFPDDVGEKDSERDEQIARIYVDPVIGEKRIAELTLDECDDVKAQITMRHADEHRRRTGSVPKEPPSPATRRHVAQYLRKLLGYAVYPGRLRTDNPIPKGWLPKVKNRKAKESLYPDEDRALLACTDVPLVRRLAYGFLAREGMRTDELARLEWRDVDLTRGRVDLDENKTDDPRSWDLDPGVRRALHAWRETFGRHGASSDRVFARDGVPLSVEKLAEQLRSDLARAGVTREKLFLRSASHQPIRAHDLRATFITIALAIGQTETWVADRTGHKSSTMINRYRRRARTWKLGRLDPLDRAIPELAIAAPPAPPRGPSRVWQRPVRRGPQRGAETARADHERIARVASREIRGDADRGSSAFSGELDRTATRTRLQNPPGSTPVRVRVPPSVPTHNPCDSPSSEAPTDSTDHTDDPLMIRSVDDVERVLATALADAAAAGRFDVVAQLARELEARRLARASNVVALDEKRLGRK